MISSAAGWISMRTSEDLELQRKSAWEAAPMEVWEEIVEFHPDMRFWVAQNKTVALEILARLATDEDARVRSMVASKRRLTPDILEQLAEDSDGAVRMDVAPHRRTPAEVLPTRGGRSLGGGATYGGRTLGVAGVR